jgi:FkbM family methyltransferase
MIFRLVKDKIKHRLNRPLRRRKKLLCHFGITKVLDVGANTGQYAKELRKINFEGTIISFEPISSIFEVLKKNMKNDTKTVVKNFALGDKNETKLINIAKNLASSSFLSRAKHLEENAKQTEYISEEKVEIKVLDSIFDTICDENDVVFLKLDTQGYEKNILNGAKESLKKIKGIQIELALKPSYKEAPNFKEIFKIIEESGFKMYSIEEGFEDEKTGQLLEIDGIFFRE